MLFICLLVWFTATLSQTLSTKMKLCKPIGIYGSLKYSGEIILKSYSKVFDLPYTIIRPSALYGERCVSRRVGTSVY